MSSGLDEGVIRVEVVFCNRRVVEIIQRGDDSLLGASLFE